MISPSIRPRLSWSARSWPQCETARLKVAGRRLRVFRTAAEFSLVFLGRLNTDLLSEYYSSLFAAERRERIDGGCAVGGSVAGRDGHGHGKREHPDECSGIEGGDAEQQVGAAWHDQRRLKHL